MAKARWIIDWTIEGTIEIEADDADEAQMIFDTRFSSPDFLDPVRDGEITNDTPYRVQTPRQK